MRRRDAFAYFAVLMVFLCTPFVFAHERERESGVSHDEVLQAFNEAMAHHIALIHQGVVRLEIIDRDHAYGSGVIIDGMRGWIVTNRHLIFDRRETAREKTIRITLANGQRLMARKIIRVSEDNDLALIEADPTYREFYKAHALPFADINALKTGHMACATGHPKRYLWSTTCGIISSLDRSANELNLYLSSIPVIQTDAIMNSGSSGGALTDWKGALIGIALSEDFDKNGLPTGLGFAVHISEVKKFYEETLLMIERGVVPKKPPEADMAIHLVGHQEYFEVPSHLRGFPVTLNSFSVSYVKEGGAAARAGLRERDIIFWIDGKQFLKPSDASRYVNDRRQEGNMVVLTLLRDNFYIVDVEVHP